MEGGGEGRERGERDRKMDGGRDLMAGEDNRRRAGVRDKGRNIGGEKGEGEGGIEGGKGQWKKEEGRIAAGMMQ